MMPSRTKRCSKCGTTSILDTTMTFHRFPKIGLNNILKAKAWAIYCWPEKHWNSVEALMKLHTSCRKLLCGSHFRECCFVDSSKKRLSLYACPGTTEFVNDLIQKLTNNVDIPQMAEVILKREVYTSKECVNSKDEAIPLHTFPNPSNLCKPEELERFRTWVMRIGGDVVGEDDLGIHRNRRVCHRHFEGIFTLPNNRLTSLAIPSILIPGKLDDNHSNDEVHNDHTYIKGVKSTTGIQSVKFGADSTSKIDLPSTTSGSDIDKNITTVRTEELATVETDELELNDFTPTSPDPPPDVGAQKEDNVFSWQNSELIPADEDEPEPEVVPTLDLEGPADPSSASLYDDIEPVSSATVPTVPLEIEYVCKVCGEGIDGFQFWCVQCVGSVLCGACDALAAHRAHHVLRVPAGRPHSKTQAVLCTIRQQLQNDNLLTIIEAVYEGVKVEVKEEPPEAAPAPPATPDPLACEPPPASPLPPAPSPQPQTQCVGDESVDYDTPFKRPRLENYHRVQNSTTASTQKDLLGERVSTVTLVGTKFTPVATQFKPVATKFTPVATKFTPVATKFTPIATNVTPIATKFTLASTKVAPGATNITPVSSDSAAELSKPIVLNDSDDEVDYTEIETLEDDMEEERIEEEYIERVEEIIEENIERVEGLEDDVIEEENMERIEGEGEEIEGDVESLENVESIFESDSESSEYIPEKRKDRRVARMDDDIDDNDDETTDESDLENIATRGHSKRIESIASRAASKRVERSSSIGGNVTKRSMDRRKDKQMEVLKISGPEEEISKVLPAKALVRVRPLSTLEVQKWTGNKKD